MLLAIDQSKRSTAAVLLDRKGSLQGFALINPDASYADEELIQYQYSRMLELIAGRHISAVVIEKPAFNGVSKDKDLLHGIYWYFRVRLKLFQSMDIPVGAVPVTSWRAAVLSKEEQREAKKEKDGLKKWCVNKLPGSVRESFEEYLKTHEARLRSVKGGSWKECIYDLTDAYWLGVYRNNLDGNIQQ